MKDYNVRYFEALHYYCTYDAGKKIFLWKDSNHFFLTYKEGIERLKSERFDPLIDTKGKHKIILYGNFKGGELSFNVDGTIKKESGIMIAWSIPKMGGKNYVQVEKNPNEIESLSDKVDRLIKSGKYIPPAIDLEPLLERIRQKYRY